MRLVFRRRKPAPEISKSPEVQQASSALQVLISSNTNLPAQEFDAQRAMLRPIATYDNDTRSWYTRVSLGNPERTVEILNALFEVARVHGTRVRVREVAAGEGAPSWLDS